MTKEIVNNIIDVVDVVEDEIVGAKRKYKLIKSLGDLITKVGSRLSKGWYLTNESDLGVEFLTLKELPKVSDQIERFISKALLQEKKDYDLLKVVVHFYDVPKDLEYPEILNGHGKLLENHFRILWVHSQPNSRFKEAMIARLTPWENQCRFIRIPKELSLIPVNFTVLAPHKDRNTYTYIRLPGYRTIKFGIKIEKTDELAIKFNELALKCLTYLENEKDQSWKNLVKKANQQLKI